MSLVIAVIIRAIEFNVYVQIAFYEYIGKLFYVVFNWIVWNFNL